MLHGPAAPSPIIPRYRPSKKVPRQRSRFPTMPTVALTQSKHFTRIPGLRKPRPRSAGASSRPVRSENIADLVHFFQAAEDTEKLAVDNNTSDMDIFKAGQRRLRTLGQTKPERNFDKGSDTSGTSEKQKSQRQRLMALQREGLLPGLGGSNDGARPSRTKQDVEAIGRPWLDDARTSMTSDEAQSSSTSQTASTPQDLPSESLTLGDLAALVEFSVSFPDLYPNEPSPPPYQAQAQPESQLQSNAYPQPQAVSLNGATAINRRDQQEGHNRNDDARRSELPGTSKTRDSRTEGASLTLSKPVQGLRSASTASTSRGPQNNDNKNKNKNKNKSDFDTNDSDSSCGSNHTNCDCDDAKSLAVLLRATERLGVENNRPRTQTSSLREPTSTTTAAAPVTASTFLAVKKTDPPPHSLNQGVTDTPFFLRKLVDEKNDGAKAARKISTKSSTGADKRPVLPLSQDEFGLSKAVNAGPIPLKLVTECLPLTVSKAASPQPLSSSAVRPRSQLNGEFTMLKPHAAPIGPTSADFPRPRALLSPIPLQSRRARSVTPDFAVDSQKKGKKKSKKVPLYVITDAAPLPPPAKPLPSLPQSARAIPQGPKTPIPAQPASAPLEYREEDRDSPVLGMNSHSLKLRRSWIGGRPSSRYSSRSIDASDPTGNVSDDQSSRTASPAHSRPESRRGRADQVHALRMRDIGVKKSISGSAIEPNPYLEPGKQSSKHSDLHNVQSSSHDKDLLRTSSRRNRVSAVPRIPLPQDPPINAQGTPNRRRRGSTSSLPGSISTTNGYDGGLSRSISVTSGSIDSVSIRRGKTAYLPKDTTRTLSNRQISTDSSLLPYSDDERHKQRLYHLKDGLMAERGANDSTRDSFAGVPKICHNQEHSSQMSDTSQHTSSTAESQMDYMRLVHHLESRVATLERQNKMLQAALLAALDVGVSHDADSVHSRSASPTLSSVRIPTISERSMLSTNTIGIDNARHQTQEKMISRHHSTRHNYTHDDGSQGSRGSFETTSSHSDSSLRAVEGMLNDLEVGKSTRKHRQ